MPRKTRKPIGKKTARTPDITNTSSLLPLYPTRGGTPAPGFSTADKPGSWNPKNAQPFKTLPRMAKGGIIRAKAAPKKTAPLGRGKKR